MAGKRVQGGWFWEVIFFSQNWCCLHCIAGDVPIWTLGECSVEDFFSKIRLMGILDLPTKNIFKTYLEDDFSIFIKKSQISLVKMHMISWNVWFTNQDKAGISYNKKTWWLPAVIYGLRSQKKHTSCCSYPQGIADTSSRLSLKRIMEQFGEAWVSRGQGWAGDEQPIWLFCWRKIRGWYYDTTPG